MIQIIAPIILFSALAVCAFLIARRIPRAGETTIKNTAPPETPIAKKQRAEQWRARAILWLKKTLRVLAWFWDWIKIGLIKLLALIKRERKNQLTPTRRISLPDADLVEEKIIPEDLLKIQKLVKQRRFEEAEKGFIDVIKKRPRDREAYQALGEMYLEQKAYQDAAASLAYAINLGAPEENVHLELARAQFKAGDRKPSLETLERLLATNPRSVAAHTLMARVYHEIGDAMNERISWNKVRVYDPDNTEAKLFLEAERGK